MDFELTRSENDERLLSQIESIKTAENIQILIPFAKAYLGMFYVIDSELREKEKVILLANTELATAIFTGFIASLHREDIPSIEMTGQAAAVKDEFSEGYVILAGFDLIAKKSLEDINNLSPAIIEKAVAFHFSNRSGHTDIWFDYLLDKQIDRIIPAISRYWATMLKNKAKYLPGKNLVLGDKPNIQVTEKTILMLLSNWHSCKAKTLSSLLHLAFLHSPKDEFLKTCKAVLEKDDSLNEKTRLYWIATAYLISPEYYFSQLSNYVGRAKLKVMPLLDFIVLIMRDRDTININISDKTIVQLLRMVAPIFPPQHHIYGALGQLDINSKNVMVLFYYLVCSTNSNVENEIKSLRKARVMKIYSSVIDNILELRIRKNNEDDFSTPSFDEFIAMLVNKNCLQGRSNKFELH